MSYPAYESKFLIFGKLGPNVVTFPIEGEREFREFCILMIIRRFAQLNITLDQSFFSGMKTEALASSLLGLPRAVNSDRVITIDRCSRHDTVIQYRAELDQGLRALLSE